MAIAIFSWNQCNFLLFLPKAPRGGDQIQRAGMSGGNAVSMPWLKQKSGVK